MRRPSDRTGLTEAGYKGAPARRRAEFHLEPSEIPRAEVASLTGAAWLAFLDRTGRTDVFSRGPGRDLEAMAFGAGGDREAVLTAARADGRWRLYAFSDANGNALRALCDHLATAPGSILRLATPEHADIDSVLDLRAVLQQPHREVRLEDLPALLLPRKGCHGLIDYEKAFTSDAATDIFDERGVDRERGALVVVRPDQYVAHVLPLDAYAELSAFFRPIFRLS